METESFISKGAIPKSKPADIRNENLDNLQIQYLHAIEREIKNNETEQDKLTKEVNKINDLTEQLKLLSTQPEWPDSFIKVNRLAYVPATIIHTSEHYVRFGSDTYSLMCLKETLDFLQRKLEHAKALLDQFKEQQKQLEERSRYLFLFSSNETADTEDMPKRIASDRGIAHKTAEGFYEVMEEYNENQEREFYKRRQQNTNKIRRQKVSVDTHDFFKRLDELERQEDSRGELEKSARNVNNVSERVKAILKQSGLYDALLTDDIIQEHCKENKALLCWCDNDTSKCVQQNENILNELIVESLINIPSLQNESNDSFNSSGKSDCEFHETISKNDLATSNFLDSIENDLNSWNLNL